MEGRPLRDVHAEVLYFQKTCQQNYAFAQKELEQASAALNDLRVRVNGAQDATLLLAELKRLFCKTTRSLADVSRLHAESELAENLLHDFNAAYLRLGGVYRAFLDVAAGLPRSPVGGEEVQPMLLARSFAEGEEVGVDAEYDGSGQVRPDTPCEEDETDTDEDAPAVAPSVDDVDEDELFGDDHLDEYGSMVTLSDTGFEEDAPQVGVGTLTFRNAPKQGQDEAFSATQGETVVVLLHGTHHVLPRKKWSKGMSYGPRVFARVRSDATVKELCKRCECWFHAEDWERGGSAEPWRVFPSLNQAGEAFRRGQTENRSCTLNARTSFCFVIDGTPTPLQQVLDRRVCDLAKPSSGAEPRGVRRGTKLHVTWGDGNTYEGVVRDVCPCGVLVHYPCDGDLRWHDFDEDGCTIHDAKRRKFS